MPFVLELLDGEVEGQEKGPLQQLVKVIRKHR